MPIATVFLYICCVIEIAVLLSVGVTLREGFKDRDSEFVNFERKLEVCYKSADKPIYIFLKHVQLKLIIK